MASEAPMRMASHKMRLLWPIILVAVAVGCASTSGTRHPVAAPAVLDEVRVLALAREAVATNDTWVARAKFETPKRQPDGSWTVLVWRLPIVSGGYRFITIDQSGSVVEYVRGL
jgi:hypothetical protein